MFLRTFDTGSVQGFKHRLLDRILSLAKESHTDSLVMPVGLFLVLDRASGGDDTADEIIRRFAFTDIESRNVIDFYFLGWRKAQGTAAGALEFDLQAFAGHREALRAAGIKEFGGNADLILIDAHLQSGRVSLDFTSALHIDLATAVAQETIKSTGAFLQGLIQATEEVRANVGGNDFGLVDAISDHLGLAVARRSILDYLLEKWGKIIGAPSLRILATRKLGPAIDLAAL